MRHISPSAHNIAYEIDADFLDGPGCDCPLCHPHASLVAFASRDAVTLNDATPPAHRFTHQRLSHRFCSTPPRQGVPLAYSLNGKTLALTVKR